MNQLDIEILPAVEALVWDKVMSWYYDYNGRSDNNDRQLLRDISEIYHKQGEETMSENYFTFTKKQVLAHNGTSIELQDYFVKIIGDYDRSRIKMTELFGQGGWSKHLTGGAWQHTGGADYYAKKGQLGKTIQGFEELAWTESFNKDWLDAAVLFTRPPEEVLQEIINDVITPTEEDDKKEDADGPADTKEEGYTDSSGVTGQFSKEKITLETELPAPETAQGADQMAAESKA